MVNPRFFLVISVLTLGSTLPGTAQAVRPRIELPPQSLVTPSMLRSPRVVRDVAVTPEAAVPEERALRGRSPQLDGEARAAILQRALGTPLEETGGDDVVLSSTATFSDIAIASNGDIFVAFGYYEATPVITEWIQVLRSRDGGDTFLTYGAIGASGDTQRRRLQRILVAEGIEDRLFVMYVHGGVQGAYSPLAAPSAAWTTRTMMSVPTVPFLHGEMTSDAPDFTDYYLYAVAVGADGDGDDLWFTRSTDFGDTWSAPYKIADVVVGPLQGVLEPRIAYGFGGAIHVAWTDRAAAGSGADDGIQYRRAVDYADSPASWDAFTWTLWGDVDGADQRVLDIAASTAGNTVLLAYGLTAFGDDPHVFASFDAGASWSFSDWEPLPWTHGTIEYRPSTGEFVGFGSLQLAPTGLFAVTAASPESDPFSWSPLRRVSDEGTLWLPVSRAAFDPTRGDRFALLWLGGPPATAQELFDAEWRADPGYPNLEAGFPVAVPNGSMSPPAIVNVDQDPYGEIVFGDDGGNIHVFNHDGSEQAGWPRFVGDMPIRAPIAIGDLAGHAEPSIVTGTTDGRVVALAPDGAPRIGFPVDLGTGADTYVSIGRLDATNERRIVACSGDGLFVIDAKGEVDPSPWNFTLPLIAPAAIGDVDDDGRIEIVTVSGPDPGTGWHFVHVLEYGTQAPEAYRPFYTQALSGPAALADLDLDGDLEIVVATKQGELFAMSHTCADQPGWPWNNGTGDPLTSVAIANIVGGFEPDIAAASTTGFLHLLFADGTQQSSYPILTEATLSTHFGAPILDQVHKAASNLVIGSQHSQAWTRGNLGEAVPGWPRTLDSSCEVSAASGDIDLDGRNELVFLTEASLYAFDVNQPPASFPGDRWPMYGNDPGRRSCLGCDDMVTTAVELSAGKGAVTFAAPWPNPAAGNVRLDYTLPGPAAVRIDVYDVAGRLVRSLLRAEQPAGAHTLTFDGCDGRGRPLDAGLYFARLTARGPGVRAGATRRLTLAR